jgi:hypothetical protein
VVTNPKTLKDIIDGYTTPEEEEAWKMKAVMEAVLTHAEFVGFLKGNIIKYAMRQGRKDSDDAAKCKHYLQKLREVEERF